MTAIGICSQVLKFKDFNICPNMLHVEADNDARGIAIALLHISAIMLKMSVGIDSNYVSHLLQN